MPGSIDIIVPVYNGLEELKQCISSIVENTDLSLHRLLIVDDKSPDSNVLPYLEMESRNHPGIVLLKNEVNQGFSASVNKGMEYSDRDVILLNSDTIVTKNWVEKIVRCAYSSEGIATVTPLSNAATLCSVPEFLKDNPLPQGMSAQDMADLVERCSLKRYPRISVAVGFCMFIKREVIEKVGFFDAQAFEKGYGEENDFCYRSEKEGYIHVMCDDTFIYHKGTASFDTEEKRKLIEEHERILIQRHEPYVRQNEQYCQKNPNKDLQRNIQLHLLFAQAGKAEDGKKNEEFLLVLEQKFPEAIQNKAFYAVRQEYSIEVRGTLEGINLRFLFPLDARGVQKARRNEQEEEILKNFLKAFPCKGAGVNVMCTKDDSFAMETVEKLKSWKCTEEECQSFDAKAFLRGYLLGSKESLGEMDLEDGLYSAREREHTELRHAYEALLAEKEYLGQELDNIYHSKRFKLACALEKLIKPLKRR